MRRHYWEECKKDSLHRAVMLLLSGKMAVNVRDQIVEDAMARSSVMGLLQSEKSIMAEPPPFPAFTNPCSLPLTVESSDYATFKFVNKLEIREKL